MKLEQNMNHQDSMYSLRSKKNHESNRNPPRTDLQYQSNQDVKIKPTKAAALNPERSIDIMMSSPEMYMNSYYDVKEQLNNIPMNSNQQRNLEKI